MMFSSGPVVDVAVAAGRLFVTVEDAVGVAVVVL